MGKAINNGFDMTKYAAHKFADRGNMLISHGNALKLC